MSRPLYRGSSGGGGLLVTGWESSDYSVLSNDHESGFGFGLNPHDLQSPAAACRNKVSVTIFLLKLSLALILVLAIPVSLYWTISVSSSSRINIYRVYRRLQEQLLTDLSEIEDLSLGVVKVKELQFCPSQYENYVPCYSNVTEVTDTEDFDIGMVQYERRCIQDANERTCLVLPPQNYRLPLRWPTGRDFIWKGNVKTTGQEFSSGSLTKRMMVEEEQISFHSDSIMVDGIEDYSHQIAEMIGLRDASSFSKAGIRNVLDIGCGFGSFGAHLFSKNLLTMCIASYEVSGSQVQLTLERGLPAIIASFASNQLPFPYLSFDMLHCAHCGIKWEAKDGVFLVEADRLLKPGGYFVWTSQSNTRRSSRIKENLKKLEMIGEFAKNLCWEMLSQQDETVVWKKTSKKKCYSSRKSGPEICSKSQDIESPYYQALHSCVAGTRSDRWIPIENRTPWTDQAKPNSSELSVYGLHVEDIIEDAINWDSVVRNYCSLLSPLIFSDHPKRPGDEVPSPPFNMLRNVLDMNARFGSFNAALLNAGKAVWVMNVVPTTSPNYLPLILDRGYIGVQHDWCEAFPTFPRTYDMVNADGLLSLESHKSRKCSMLDMFLEIDRILRPEGWVILQDTARLIESARHISAQLKWDARLIKLDVKSDKRLLICQKPFFRNLQK